MKIMVVTAGIIRNQERILLTQRKEDTDQGLKWEFPGGKLEFGETPEQCLVREIKEELDIEIAISRLFQVVSHTDGDRQIILLCYLCDFTKGYISPKECHDYRWVEKKDLLTHDLAPADIPVARQLMEN